MYHPYIPVVAVVANPAAGLCCSSIQPHNHAQTHWEAHFSAFLAWIAHSTATPPVASAPPSRGFNFVVRLTTTVRATPRLSRLAELTPLQINMGRMCGAMDYAQKGSSFVHVASEYAEEHGFVERCGFKNFTCPAHGIYFQVDLYRM